MRTTLNMLDLREHFLDREGGSLATLDQNFSSAIAKSDGWHNHAIFLYHATKNAVAKELYGRNTAAAGDVIRSHIREWTDKALKLRGVPEPWIIPQTLTAFRMLQVRPPKSYVALCQKAAAGGLRRYKTTDVLAWFSAAADLTLQYDDKFLQGICARAVQLAPEMRGAELYNLGHMMAIMDAVEEARGARKPFLGQAFSNIFSNPKVKAEVERCKSREEPQKLADAKFWFARESHNRPPDYTEQDSVLQYKVGEEFKAAGARPIRRRTLRDTGHQLDLSFQFNGCNFDVEVDGPVHFVRSTDGHIITLDGTSVFQTLLIREKDRERKIVRLPYTVYDDHAGKPAVWRNLCDQIHSAAAGAFMVASDGTLSSDLLVKCQISDHSAALDAAYRKVTPP